MPLMVDFHWLYPKLSHWNPSFASRVLTRLKEADSSEVSEMGPQKIPKAPSSRQRPWLSIETTSQWWRASPHFKKHRKKRYMWYWRCYNPFHHSYETPPRKHGGCRGWNHIIGTIQWGCFIWTGVIYIYIILILYIHLIKKNNTNNNSSSNNNNNSNNNKNSNNHNNIQ